MAKMFKYPRYQGDDLLSTDSRLKYRWWWYRGGSALTDEEIKHMTHFQISFARIGDWELRSIQWTEEQLRDSPDIMSYEASINVSTSDASSLIRKEKFKTRLEGQLGAEKLLSDWLNNQNKFING